MPFPVDLKWVREAEQKLEAKLPLDYVAYLHKCNGGEVSTSVDDWYLYPVWDKSSKKMLSRTCNDIVRETKQSKDWPDFPDHAIAIGDNGGGDKLVILRGDDSIYAWDHETAVLIKQADTFAEIVDGNGN